MIWDCGSPPAGEKGRALLDKRLAPSRSPSVWPVSTRCTAFAYGFLDKQAVTLAADPGDDGCEPAQIRQPSAFLGLARNLLS